MNSELSDSFLHNLLVFARLLRWLGLDVAPEQVSDCARILATIGIERRDDFYYAARSLFVHRRSDLPLFDHAFNLFFSIRGKPQQSIIDPTQAPAHRALRPKQVPQVMERERRRTGETDASRPESESPDTVMVYSPLEVLRKKNFEQFTHDEIRAVRKLIAAMDWQVGERRTRRKRAAQRGTQIDFKRLVRHNLRHGVELFQLPKRELKSKPRMLVVLADISGSMERYTRMVLHLLHALSHELARVEVFTFGTHLTRITPDLRKRSVDAALARVSQRVPDWSGGTRIGDALKTFNYKWARRVLRAGAVVMIISDGWDRGDLGMLSHEMARLQRSCFRLIWLNPLLGDASFTPNAQGLQVALPYVDDFLPVHNLDSLDQLVEKLATLDETRPLRRQQPRVVMPELESKPVQKTMERPQMGTSDYVRRTIVVQTTDGVPRFGYDANPDESE